MVEFSLSKIVRLIEKANSLGVSMSFSGNELSVHVEKGRQIDPVLLGELKEHKPFLIQYYQQHAAKENQVPISHQLHAFNRQEIKKVPLSFAQERLWFIDQLEGSLQYHLPTVLRLTGKINPDALNDALQNLVNRHEILRTIIREEDGRGYQYLKDAAGYAIQAVNGRHCQHSPEALQLLIQELIRQPFDLSRDYMLRTNLVSIADEEHVLVVTMHHIASDAWSTAVLVKEVVELYSAFIQGRTPILAPLEIQYADYAVWQRNYLQGDLLEKKVNYWKEKLEGITPIILPADHVRPPVQTSRGANSLFTINKTLAAQLQKLSQQQGTTLFMTMLAAFKVLLYRYSGQQDICVGTSIASRNQQALEGLIGFFVNTLVLRDTVVGDASFINLLQQVKITTLQAYGHQDVPFERVVEAVVKERDPARNPLFQVMLVLGNTPEVAELKLGEVQLVRETYNAGISKFDITFFVNETSDGLHGKVEYSTDLYNESTIRQMTAHFEALLNAIVKDPTQSVGTIPMLSSLEQKQILESFNDSRVAYPTGKSIVDLFEEQVAKTPAHTAVVFEDKTLTYQQLNERSNQLAHLLKSRGVKPGSLVPIYLERSVAMITGMLGIMKAGAAYVPIDTDFPLERTSYMLEDIGATVIVSSQLSSSKLPADAALKIIAVDEVMPELQPSTNLAKVTPDQLAYVIYTSGSTGKPKGVMIEHRSLSDYYFGLHHHTQIGQCKSFALVSTIATDLGNTVIYASLLSGGALHIFSKNAVSNIEYLHQYFGEHNIDCLKIVPSHWKALAKDDDLLLPKKLLVFGGEALQSELVENIYSSGVPCRVINHYGPTETTIGKLLHEVKPTNTYNNTIPVGRPFSNTKVYVLSKEKQLCPVGVPGQLFIAGDGVARGYFNNPDLSKEKFIADPFDKSNKSKMYGSGDLVKWLPDGNILFIGRVDDQVKIRGYRIELGEIEAVLQQSALVSQAVVLAKDDKQGNKKLVGYIVAANDFDRDAINTYLKEKLPDYMIPAVLVELESLPLTANGKVDRKALPDPDVTAASGDQYIAPRNETETKLAAIWQDILEVDRVGMNDDFFELGGHSLLAVRLVSAIRKAFKVEMPIGDIFDYPLVALLASRITEQAGNVVLPAIQVLQPRPNPIPLSFSQERLWFIDQLEGSVQYHVPAILRLKGNMNKAALLFALQQIINRHEILRTVIKEGADGQGYQYVQPVNAFSINNVEGVPCKDDPIALRRLLGKLVNKPFDLSKDHMLRADLVKLNDTEHILAVTLHHIASDGWSASIIVNELVTCWNAFEAGETPKLALLPLQYADFALWQRGYLQGEVLHNKLAYWKQYLQGVEPLQMPTDYVHPVTQSTRGAFTCFVIDKAIANGLQRLSQQEGTTLFMTLLAAFKVLLFRYSGQQDICVGTPIAGRQQQELEGLIGFFVNTLALRTELNDTATFKELLQQVRANTLKAYEHQEVPFEKVVEAVVKERELSRSPLFQVMFILQNTPQAEGLQLGNMELSYEANDHDTTKFELTFSMAETADGMTGAVEYCPDLYSEQTIEKMLAHFNTLLKAVVTNPAQSIATLPMLSHLEEEQLLVAFNNTGVAYPREKSITRLFEQQVTKTPERVALVFESRQLTYQALNERSNQLAHYLINKGVSQHTLVPICIERSIEMVIGVVAILKAGAAYVPVDPDYPAERISYMLEDISAPLVLTSKSCQQFISTKSNVELLELDTHWFKVNDQPGTNPVTIYDPLQLAYLIYTSGSTGRPKGVKMPGGALVNLLSWQEKQFANKQRRVLQFASLNFDVSFQEIFSTLCFGSSLYLINADRRKDVAELIKDIVDHHITHLFVPYIVLKNLADNILINAYDSFRLEEVIVAGEQLKLTEDIGFLLKNNIATIINQYGPTEAHVVSSYRVDSSEVLPPLPPIGKPIDNTRLYILSSSRQLVPVGVAGELYIGGVQVAQGYLNQPQQTADKFIPDFFSKDSSAGLYKTGDMARWLPDGNIEYLGRIDDQVKIRGYRIELGEIESLLQECELVRQAVVLAKTDTSGNKRLVSYIVPEGQFHKEKLVAFAKATLPEYMVPALWVQMDKLPVTRNGKIDKKSLPDPDASELIGNAFVAPRNAIETTLVLIWKQLLGVEKVGVNDNFFELGGHSLLATRTVSMIRKQLEVELAIKDLFIYPTVATLATHMAAQNKELLLPAITVQPRPQHIPLSFSQERLWFFDKLEGSLPYYLPTVLRLKGNLNKEALAFALQQIVNRHEVLRTVIREEDGQGYQFIMDRNGWQLSLADGSSYDEPASLKKFIQQLINQPFDLSADHMLRAHLVKLGDADHILVVTMHHIASDGWSVSVLVKEVMELYGAAIEQREAVLVPLEIQYADYAIWQRSYLQGELFEKKLDYWKEKLQGVTALQLPADYPRPAVQSTRGGIRLFSIENDVKDQLQLLSQQENVTLFMTLLAAFNVLLNRYSGQQDICVGIPIAGRQQQEVEVLIGFFINTVALRSDLDNTLSFKAFLQQVKQTTLDAYDHQEVPFEKVVEAVVKDRDMSRSPLFQVMFMFQNTPDVPQLKLGDLELTGETSEHLNSKYDVTLTVTETATELRCAVEYCTDLFKESTIIRLTEHFTQLIKSIVASPVQKLNALPMLIESEKQLLLNDFNQTQTDYAANKSMVDLFEEQVLKTPGKLAVVFEEQQLSYLELNEKANRFANYLRSKGVVDEMLVPICIERSVELMIGILGIMKAGAAYVPVDPDYPADRISYMLEDTGATIVVSSSKSRSKIQTAAEISIVELDDEPAYANQSENNLANKVLPNHLAYVIYTSGSTGKPKGVMIEHTSVVNLLTSIAGTVQFNAKSIFLSVTTYSFDIAYLELYMPLIYGGSLVIASREVAMNGFLLAEKISSSNPTHLQATPSTWQILLDCEWENKEGLTMLIGGEAIKEDIKESLTKLGDLYNCYGPTETTIWSVIKKLEPNEKVVIGKPIANTNIAILDSNNQLCPIGVAGEICIGGAGLARGYFKRPELTADKFINDPFSNISGTKLYRTGDLGRWLADGNMECLGRLDEQVKIRGFRIELGEIETVLEQCELVEQAVILAKEDKQSNKRLVAYIVPKGTFEREAIIQFIKGKLPAYMVPALWVAMETLPLTPNGKINRKALPDPDISALIVNNYTPPRNETEKVLAVIWQELLGVERVGIHDNFFELGGHSLLIIKMVALIRKQLSFTIPVLLLFQFTTISDISKYLDWQQSAGQEEDITEFEVLSI